MPSPKYPLKPLLEHRERQVDDATGELGGAVRAREAADAVRVHAERARREVEERTARVRFEEAEHLARGELRVADLVRADAWEVGARAEMGQRIQSVELADDTLRAAREAESAARRELAQAMAARDVVARDRARFDERRRNEILAGEEEAAEEVFRGGQR